LTHDGLLIAGSETGLVDLDESRVAESQRLGPGEMILANPVTGLFLRWRDILKRLAIQQARNAIPQRMLAASVAAPSTPVMEPKRVAGAAGWTEDQFKILFSALTRGKEADWSMGDDAPPAFLSALPRTLWDYCKQRFAQVTNPPIDPLRETHVMSLDVHLKDGLTVPCCLISRMNSRNLSNRAAWRKLARPSTPACEKFLPAWASPPWPAIATATFLKSWASPRISAHKSSKMPPIIPARNRSTISSQ